MTRYEYYIKRDFLEVRLATSHIGQFSSRLHIELGKLFFLKVFPSKATGPHVNQLKAWISSQCCEVLVRIGGGMLCVSTFDMTFENRLGGTDIRVTFHISIASCPSKFKTTLQNRLLASSKPSQTSERRLSRT